jgi:hypothetical protein
MFVGGNGQFIYKNCKHLCSLDNITTNNTPYSITYKAKEKIAK